MIRSQARLVLIVLAMSLAAFAIPGMVSAVSQQPAATVQAAAPRATDAIVMVDVVDVSGSLAKAIKAMSAAETQQLTSTLKPDDIYARVNFDGTARLAVLMPVREPADIDRITTVLAQNVSATGRYTSIAAGLMKAREVVEKERDARRVVLAVITDGILSTPDGIAPERKRLESITSWWKGQPWVRRIVVGVGPDKTGAVPSLAKALDAELVTLDEYSKRSIVARAIAGARIQTGKANSTANPPVAPPPPLTRWLWVVGAAVAALGFGYWHMRLRSPRKPTAQPIPPLSVASIAAPPEMQVTARVTATGRVVDTVVDVVELQGDVLTLGTGATVFVPGLQGHPVNVTVTPDSMAVTVEPGRNVRLNGENVDAVPQPVNVGRSCRLTYGGVAIALRLHPRGARSRLPTRGLQRRIG